MAHVKFVAVVRITLRVGDVLIELTPDEARRLARELDELFNHPRVYAPSVMPVFSELPEHWTSTGTNGDYVTLGSVTIGEMMR